MDLYSARMPLTTFSYQCVEITLPSADLYAVLVILDQSAAFPPYSEESLAAWFSALLVPAPIMALPFSAT